MKGKPMTIKPVIAKSVFTVQAHAIAAGTFAYAIGYVAKTAVQDSVKTIKEMKAEGYFTPNKF
jgi:hypothetical protein